MRRVRKEDDENVKRLDHEKDAEKDEKFRRMKKVRS
jgi:hypothetical protein